MKKRTPRPRIRYPLQKTPFVVLLFFLALWIAGIASGEPKRVLEQAWQICLSCIGIG
jgi:hypothetical protein